MSILLKTRETFLRVRSNNYFESFVAFIIILSALNVGINTYEGIPTNYLNFLSVIDYVITVFFLIEIIIRMISEESLKKFFQSGWIIFDFIIIVVSLIPAALFESVLLLRLIRVFRLLRLISIFPQFRVLIESLIKAIPRVGYVILFMFINFYIFAALGSIFFSEIDPLHWGNIGLSLLTLFQTATLEGWPDLMYDAFAYNPYSWIFFVVFIILNSLIFMNMIVGVIIDVIVRENQKEDPENIMLLRKIDSDLQKVLGNKNNAKKDNQ